MEQNKIKKIFWDVLPVKMKEANIKAVDLASALGLSKSTVSCWTRRKSFPEMDNIQRIADVLGCKTDDLLGRNVEELSVELDRLLVSAYHAADEGTKAAVRKLLDIKGVF